MLFIRLLFSNDPCNFYHASIKNYVAEYYSMTQKEDVHDIFKWKKCPTKW